MMAFKIQGLYRGWILSASTPPNFTSYLLCLFIIHQPHWLPFCSLTMPNLFFSHFYFLVLPLPRIFPLQLFIFRSTLPPQWGLSDHPFLLVTLLSFVFSFFLILEHIFFFYLFLIFFPLEYKLHEGKDTE